MSWLKKNKSKLLVLAGLVILSYANTWRAEFVADDVYGIVNNPEIFKWQWVWQNPLIVWGRLEYFLVSNMFGLTEWAFRMTNVMAHIGVVGLVLWLGSRLVNKRVGMMAAALTAVHPIMIESVTWISGGGYAKYSFWLMLAFVLYIKASRKTKYLVWSSLAYLVALQYSEKAVVLPGILVVYRLIFAKKRKQYWDLVPFVGLAGIWTVANLMNVGSRLEYLQVEYSNLGGDRGLKPWVQIPIAISEYLGLSLWPNKLTLYHSEMVFSLSRYWMSVVVVVGLMGTGLWGWLKSYKVTNLTSFGRMAFWLGWIVIGLAQTLTRLGVSWIVAERYFYLSSIGVWMILGMLVDRLARKEGFKEGVMLGFAVLVGLLMIRTVVRNADWRTPDKLWLAAKRTSPNSPQNNNNLGDYYGRMGDFKQSEWHFKRAIEINPNYADAMHNLANTYVRVGEVEKAIEYYLKAVEKKPQLWQSLMQLGLIYKETGEKEKAVEAIDKALVIVPEHEGLTKIRRQLTGE